MIKCQLHKVLGNKCKHCGSDLTGAPKSEGPNQQKVQSPQPPPAPKKKTSGCLIIFLVLIVLTIVGAIFSAISDSCAERAKRKQAPINLLESANNSRKMKNYDEAIRNYEVLIKKYPHSKQAKIAKETLPTVQQENNQFILQNAKETASNLVKNWDKKIDQPAAKSETKAPSKNSQQWQIIAEPGLSAMVYVSPEGIKDKNFVAQVLQSVMNSAPRKPIQIMLFDDKDFTPTGFPMTDSQMLHWKGTYYSKPNIFYWNVITNPYASPPEWKETETNIKPGYAG